MGSKPSYPKPTSQELSLQQSQADLLNQQRGMLQGQMDQQKLLQPLILQQMGLKPTYGTGAGDTGMEFQNGQWVQARPNTIGQQQIIGYEQGPPTPEQTAAREQQQAILDQLHLNQAMLPAQLEQQGYRPTYGERVDPSNPTGPPQRFINGVEAIPGSNQELERNLQRQFLERSGQAMRGELPVDPTLQRQFDTSERTLRDSLLKNLGPGYETSTPGIQALTDFGERKNNSIYSAQHGEIGSAAQLALAMQQGNLANYSAGQTVSNPSLNSAQALQPFSMQGTTGASMQGYMSGVQAPFQGLGGLGTLSDLYGKAQAPYAQQRQDEYQNVLYKKQTSIWPTVGRMVGSAAGAYFGGPMGASAGGSAGETVGKAFA